MNIKMIASDIDGTLLGKGGALSQNTREALRACEARGIFMVLASGRTFYGARGVALEAGLRGPVISANGGRADANPQGGVVFEDVIAPEMSRRIYELLASKGCFMTSYVSDRIYKMDETNGFGSTCAKRSEAKNELAHVIANDAARMLAEGTKNPYKYEAYSDDARLMDELRRELVSWGLSVSSAFPYNLEIMSPGGGKGRALKALAEKLGVTPEETMAFGDGTNDKTMLEFARYGVAMENGVDALKEIAWKIAPRNDEDGVAKILRKYVLSEAGI